MMAKLNKCNKLFFMSLVLPNQTLLNINNDELILFDNTININGEIHKLKEIDHDYYEDYETLFNNDCFYKIKNTPYICIKYKDKLIVYNIENGNIEDVSFRLDVYRNHMQQLLQNDKIGDLIKLNRKLRVNIQTLFLVFT